MSLDTLTISELNTLTIGELDALVVIGGGGGGVVPIAHLTNVVISNGGLC